MDAQQLIRVQPGQVHAAASQAIFQPKPMGKCEPKFGAPTANTEPDTHLRSSSPGCRVRCACSSRMHSWARPAATRVGRGARAGGQVQVRGAHSTPLNNSAHIPMSTKEAPLPRISIVEAVRVPPPVAAAMCSAVDPAARQAGMRAGARKPSDSRGVSSCAPWLTSSATAAWLPHSTAKCRAHSPAWVRVSMYLHRGEQQDGWRVSRQACCCVVLNE